MHRVLSVYSAVEEEATKLSELVFIWQVGACLLAF